MGDDLDRPIKIDPSKKQLDGRDQPIIELGHRPSSRKPVLDRRICAEAKKISSDLAFLVDETAIMENEISEVGLELDNSDPQDIEPNEEMMDKSIEGGDTLTSVDGDAIVEEPAKGMEFDNEEDARGFYFDYARRVGFTIRIDKVRRSMRDRAIIARQYVCSKEGFCVSRRLTHEYKRQRTVKREGCMARMMVKREKSGKWVVSSFIKEHNHELVVATREECCLQSRKHKCCATRKSSKVGCGEGSNGFYGRDVMSCIETSPQGTFGREAQKVLDYFRGKQAKDPTFFYDVQLDDNRCLSNVIWADERSRRDYGYFGDVVAFDTTYKMNGYQVPFASFMGVNHHRQPVLFGCVLIADQSEASYVWMFKTWLSAMQGRHPISMITVQDRAIQSAAAQVFPRTRHRFCLSHVLKRLWEHLPPMFLMQENFREDFNKCINQTDTVDEFEMNWRSLADRYALRNNEWFQTLHRDRQQWVPACLRNTFFAELSMTHQVNTFFDGYVNSHTTLKMIFKQVERALEGQVKKEVEEDFETTQTPPILKTPSPMEKQASELYTKEIFSKFQEELVETYVYTANKIKEDGDIDVYRVEKFQEEHKLNIVRFSVSEMRVNCSCQMYEYLGILCRHILTVFKVTNILTLPPHYILRRWTRDAKSGDVLEGHGVDIRGNCRVSLSLRYDNLVHEAIKFAKKGATSIDMYNVAMCALREAALKVDAAANDIMVHASPSFNVFQNGSQTDRSDHAQLMGQSNQGITFTFQ